MRLSKRVENLGEWGSVKVLSRSESRRAWEGMRAATVPWIVFKLLLLLPVGVFSVLGTDPTIVEAFAVAGLFAGLSLISAGVFSMQRQVPFENVRRLPGLALTVRD